MNVWGGIFNNIHEGSKYWKTNLTNEKNNNLSYIAFATDNVKNFQTSKKFQFLKKKSHQKCQSFNQGKKIKKF